MKNHMVLWMAQSAIVAALYVVLTWVLAPISYGAIQFRISEILMLLVVFQPKFAPALILGCFLSNTTSSLGWYDMVFGTLATALAVLPMMKIKRMELAALFPVISNALIVSLELWLAFQEPYGLSVVTVGLGEAVVLYAVGIPVMSLLRENQGFLEAMHWDASSVRISANFSAAFVFGALSIIFYVAYPFTNGSSALALTKDHLWCMGFAIIGGILLLVGFLPKKIQSVFCGILWIALLSFYILIGLKIEGANQYHFYYFYIAYLLFFLGWIFYKQYRISKK